jgi:hypothetical protein
MAPLSAEPNAYNVFGTSVKSEFLTLTEMESKSAIRDGNLWRENAAAKVGM